MDDFWWMLAQRQFASVLHIWALYPHRNSYEFCADQMDEVDRTTRIALEVR